MTLTDHEPIQATTRQNELGTDPITAAIIGAIATLAAATMSETSRALSNSGSAITQGAVIENQSELNLSIWKIAKPSHGEWTFSPSQESQARPNSQTAFEAWKMSGKAPDAMRDITDVDNLDEAGRGLLMAWIRTDFKDPKTATLGLNSTGMGVESVVVYRDQTRDIAVALYLDSPKIGETQAGCMITTQREVERFTDPKDGELKKLWRHIRDANTSQTKRSEGELKTVALDGFKISFNAARETTFLIEGP